uniref:PDZ domain-containing protein n=1 Tax=Ananas comosus var. bracteatus TaxID=296719 RepID=A0A6V7PM24_ANACO|nr:unnamed protein product [Ananas comosus var. bracteatus]
MQSDSRSSEEKMRDLSPWRHEISLGPSSFVIMENTFKNTFRIYDSNADLDIYSKRAALKSSETVASLVSFVGEEILFCASGTTIECNSTDDGIFEAFLLTTASLLRRSNSEDIVADNIKIIVHFWDGKSYEGDVIGCDFYYNIATVRIRSEVPLQTAILRDVDDSMPISPEVARDLRETTKPTLGRHSNKFILVPGDKVVAVGRYHTEGYDLMVAPGIFSADCCRLDCKELFRANCKITKSGIGGPLLNLDGEVIGINFIGRLCTPFLPMNIVSRWWTHFKRHGLCHGQFCRPWIGVEATNLFSGRVDVLEHIVRKFPNFSKGVIVEKVEQGSPADIAGINPNDVIVQCDGKKVKNFLGLFKKIYKKVGQAVELEVIRPHDGAHLTVSVFVSESTLVNRYISSFSNFVLH